MRSEPAIPPVYAGERLFPSAGRSGSRFAPRRFAHEPGRSRSRRNGPESRGRRPPSAAAGAGEDVVEEGVAVVRPWASARCSATSSRDAPSSAIFIATRRAPSTLPLRSQPRRRAAPRREAREAASAPGQDRGRAPGRLGAEAPARGPDPAPARGRRLGNLAGDLGGESSDGRLGAIEDALRLGTRRSSAYRRRRSALLGAPMRGAARISARDVIRGRAYDRRWHDRMLDGKLVARRVPHCRRQGGEAWT